ncbi:MAG: hypothetical protein ABIG55_04270 [Candidatus Omnitrophota bacterium]|nr:hypothetical protein [Candidatus Omnitrophota bacterium]
MKRTLRTKNAVTFIELFFVVLILAGLMAIVMVKIGKTDLSAKISADMANVHKINEQTEKWHFEKGYWPLKDLSDIGENNKYFPEGIPTCPVDGSAYEIDETSHRVTGHVH